MTARPVLSRFWPPPDRYSGPAIHLLLIRPSQPAIDRQRLWRSTHTGFARAATAQVAAEVAAEAEVVAADCFEPRQPRSVWWRRSSAVRVMHRRTGRRTTRFDRS